jgi:hypothetical protein
VAHFFVGSPGSTFDSRALYLTDQGLDTRAITAFITSAPSRNFSTVRTLQLIGDGGSIQTKQPIFEEITSTGPVGDVTLTAPEGLPADFTAPSFFGNLSVTAGAIAGTVQTTAGDIGLAYVTADGTLQTTSITADKITGRIISRGNLNSSVTVNNSFTGVLAAQGDIGAILRNADGTPALDAEGKLKRAGSLAFGGGFDGQLVALGNVFADISVQGATTGRMASGGRTVGFTDPARDAGAIGFLGNIRLNGTFTGAIVSRGVIGDDGVYVADVPDTDGSGTTLTTNGSMKGILGAFGDINFDKPPSGDLPAGALIAENATDRNRSAIDAIFTHDGAPLAFDKDAPLDLVGLDLILSDLANLHVGDDGQLDGTHP